MNELPDELPDKQSSGLPTEINIEQIPDLLAYLRQKGYIAADETPWIDVLAGGVSNRTVLVERENGDGWVLKQALRKLRVPVDWFSSPQRVHREALGMHWLARLAPPDTITPLVFEDHEQHLIAMHAVPQPHENWKSALLRGELRDTHVIQFGKLLAAVHGNASLLRDEVEPVFADRSFFESLRLEPYYGYTAEQVPAARSFLYGLIDETRTRQLTLVHGDYSPKNILVYDGRLVLLDHEVIHWGDPAFDLGFSLTHLLSKAHHLAAQRAGFAAAARLYWSTYRNGVADADWVAELEEYAVRHTLACLLARVHGRSPLEYLTETERAQQRHVTLHLMQHTPTSVNALINLFVDSIK